ncbi:MAG: hypothetical protein DGJ47_000497 [Rickettsiaceae bacterium]
MKDTISTLLRLIITFFYFSFNICCFATENTEIKKEPYLTSFADIVEPLIPTVVNIYTVKLQKQTLNGNFLTKLFSSEKVDNFTNEYNIPDIFKKGETNSDIHSLGSGFIVDPKGFIITNYHVISGSDEIFIKLSNNVEFPARIIGTDPKTDLALLKIEVEQQLPFVNFADSSRLRIGDIVIAIGNPFGFGGTVTTGIISSKSRDLGIDKSDLVDNFIQTDATINIGSSGGPLFNINGDVIGVNTAIPKINSTNNFGIGFSIPANTVQSILSELKEKRKS